ncbi:sensor domain-containing protein [Mycobacterium sp. CBMA335]|uniref:PknH-like extracellular domain-containing protein n=3 Tax=Mycolicibacterium sp. CBMA 213 TaxID=1968788 RepID=A0A343VRS4_9MYCO|nr:hypothetical protein B5P44_p00306 [Mycolicibacterium sp. CBMA 213]MUL61235.1 sensor domain-containing protein [Mycolicibacterium sp. CBMA 335]
MPAGSGYLQTPANINGPAVQATAGHFQSNEGGPTAPTAPRKRPRWIMPVALLAVMAVSAGITYAVAGRSDSDSSAVAHGGDTTYRIMPTKMLPTLDQMQQTTLLSLKPSGGVSVAVLADTAVTPDSCRFAYNDVSQVAWGSAVSVAFESFTDNTASNFTATAFVGLAVFSAPQAAGDIFKKVSDSVRGCTEINQLGTDTTKPSTWTVSDVHTGDRAVTWSQTQKGSNPTWVCGKSNRVVGNLVASASLCGQNPADSPTRLTDLVIATATKQ